MQLIKLVFQVFVFVLPLIFLPTIFNSYELPKFIFFAAATELLTVIFVLYWLLSKSKETIFPKIDLGVFLVLSFGIISLIADIFGVSPMNSIFGSFFRRQGFITLMLGIIIFLLLRSPLLFKNILPIFRKTVVASAFLISAIALFQVIQINIFHMSNIPTYNSRIVATLGNPNFLGGYLAMLLPFVLWYPTSHKKKLFYTYRIFAVFLILIAVLFTDSVSSFIAIALIILIYFFRLFMKIPLPKVILLIILALILWLTGQKTANFIFEKNTVNQSAVLKDEKRCFENWPNRYPLKIITDIKKSNNLFFKRDSPCDSRLLIWVAGLNSLIKYPVLGLGRENFGLLMPQGNMYKVDNAHNIFLETAVSSGAIGIALYISILVYFLRKSSFDIKMSLIAFVIIGQFNPLSIAHIALFWILLGLSQKEQREKRKLTIFLGDRII